MWNSGSEKVSVTDREEESYTNKAIHAQFFSDQDFGRVLWRDRALCF